jgi:hypothetical protein
MNVQELIKKGSLTGEDRRTLYLSEFKAHEVYIQTVAQVTEMVETEKGGGKVSMDLNEILKLPLKLEGQLERGFEQKVAITPLLQAMVIERAAEQAGLLIDLTIGQKPVNGPLIRGPLMRYIGMARFDMEPWEDKTPDATIPQAAWGIISKKRAYQERVFKWNNNHAAVLTFTIENAVYASIASSESLTQGFRHYYRTPPFSMLCRMVGPAEEGVTLLDPIWIWHVPS